MFSFSSAHPKLLSEEVDGVEVVGWTQLVGWLILLSFFKGRGVIEVMFNSGRTSQAFKVLEQSVGRLSRRPCRWINSIRDRSGKLKGRLSRRWGRRAGRPKASPGVSAVCCESPGVGSARLESSWLSAGNRDRGGWGSPVTHFEGSIEAPELSSSIERSTCDTREELAELEVHKPERPGGSEALLRWIFSMPISKTPSSDQAGSRSWYSAKFTSPDSSSFKMESHLSWKTIVRYNIDSVKVIKIFKKKIKGEKGKGENHFVGAEVV